MLGHKVRYRLLCSEGGATLTEYAVLVALLTAGCLAAYGAVSVVTNYGFHLGQAVGISFDDSHLRSRPGPQNLTAPDNEFPRRERAWFRLARYLVGIAIWCVLLASSWAVWRQLRTTRSAQKTAAQKDESLPVAAEHERILFEKRRQICRIIAESLTTQPGQGPEVRHLMSDRVVAVRPTTSIAEVAQLMAQRRIRHLLVTDARGKLLGIISDRDIKNRQGAVAGDIMTPNPITVPPSAQLAPSITMLLRKGISCLPVVENGKVCGVLTTTDMLLSLQAVLQALAKLSPDLANGQQQLHRGEASFDKIYARA